MNVCFRHTIVGTASVVAIVMLTCVATAAAAEIKNPFFAMDTVANRGTEPIEEKLDDLKRMGYTGIAWTGTNVAQIESVVKACDARGLKLYALYVGCPLTEEKLAPPENIDAVFDAVASHGTVVWLFIQSKVFKPSDTAGDAIALPGLKDLADRAARRRVTLALYPHTGFWAQTFGDCLRLAEAVDRPNFGVSFNLCHVLKTGDEKNIAELLRRAKPRLAMVTINGADADSQRAGWDRLIQPIGQGSFDLAPLLKQLQAIGYSGPIGFQGYGIKGDRREILRQTMDGWRKVCAGVE